MANNYVKVENDKFNNKTVTTMKKPYRLTKTTLGGLYHLTLRHVSAPSHDSLLIDVYYQGFDWAFLRNGSMIININNVENIELEAHESYSDTMTVGESVECVESDYYEINQEILKKICDAQSVDIKIAGSNTEKVKEANQFIEYARHFYSDFYDENAYKDSDSSSSSKGGCMGAIMIAVSIISSLAACFVLVVNAL